MMIVFDVDGTLIGGEKTDWKCFDEAFKEAAGFALTSDFFHTLKEVTAKAIVHQALDLAGAAMREKQEIELKARQGFLERLEKAVQEDPDPFPAKEGAVSLIQGLRKRGVPVAIATGDWKESILVKLNAAGIPVDNIPMTTSSDYYSRAEIIASSIEKAGGDLASSIYVGDGHWDLSATRKLGIAFIGCGTKLDRLREEGAQYLLERLDIIEFRDIMEEIKTANNRVRFT